MKASQSPFDPFRQLPPFTQALLLLGVVALLVIAGCVPGAVTPMLALLLALKGFLPHDRK